MSSTVSYDGFTYETDDEAFRWHIERGLSEPYPKQLAIVQRYLRQFPHKSRSCVDVGAHIGTTMLPYSRMYERVVGYEANAKNFGFLEANLKANQAAAGNCRAVYTAVADCSGMGTIRPHAGGNSGCFYFKKEAGGTLPCRRLDDEPLYDVDFLKIDVEGSELLVLRGAEQILLRDGPLIHVEVNWHSENHYGLKTSELEQYLLSLGYLAYDKSDDHNWFFYRPASLELAAKQRIVCFWTGENAMTTTRELSLSNLRKTSGGSVLLLTPETWKDHILQTEPLHPGFQYLSAVHKADYLRTYFMHFYGGGYSDIKGASGSWAPAFAAASAAGAPLLIGYKEAGEGCIAVEELRQFWARLPGNGAYIVQPATELTRAWYQRMLALVSARSAALAASPARGPRDCAETGSSYPIQWNEMLGRIFHRVAWEHADKIDLSLPVPLLSNYM